MINIKLPTLLICTVLLLPFACNRKGEHRYADDLALVEKRTAIVELKADGGAARALVTPDLQGRILTTTAAGTDGASNGWFDRAVFTTNDSVTGGVGGEDRVWITPLGSQHSFYYGQSVPLNEDNWSVPAPIEHEPFTVMNQSARSVWLRKDMTLTNFSGTALTMQLDRRLTLHGRAGVEQQLGVSLPEEVVSVGFTSDHRLKNTGNSTWTKASGLAGIWNAGTFLGTDGATVILPLRRGKNLDDLLTYMGPLGEERLWQNGSAAYFRGDGRYRSKVGIPPRVARDTYAAYVPEADRLTIVRFSLAGDTLYANTAVSIQDDPYRGEAIPIYNNGPLDYQPTEEVSFFELESTSALRELKPGWMIGHSHEVYHLIGEREDLAPLCRQLTGAELPQ